MTGGIRRELSFLVLPVFLALQAIERERGYHCELCLQT